MAGIDWFYIITISFICIQLESICRHLKLLINLTAKDNKDFEKFEI